MLPSKTGVFNDSVTLDSTKTKFLDPFRKALHVAGNRSRTWKFTYNQFCREFGKAAASLGLKLVPYMARHSGPSMDLASGERDLAGVRKRLRVSGLKTLDRYERAANLGQEWSKLNASQKEVCIKCKQHIEAYICGRPSPLDTAALPTF